MDEVILFPSPNWFQVSGLAVSCDGWVVYGGPSKSLCVLQPLPADYSGLLEAAQRYTAHVLNRANPDKIVSVDLSPEWPVHRLVLTGSSNGSVKQWALEEEDGTFKIESNLSHNVHAKDHEGVLTVAYVTDLYAVTLGVLGNLVRWDIRSNVVKTYKNLMRAFKPTCMACSPHVPLNVAVGTKQGVLFVLDLGGEGTILYKVRSQDDEIMNVSWCPQYEVQIKKLLDDPTVAGAPGLKPQKPNPKKFSASDRLEKIRQQKEPEEKNVSGIVKNLPDDSFDDFEVVQEDDMFDIYKDHEADEFGHKKYEPEDILVKIKEPKKEMDYLAECLKLKDDILNKKSEPEPTIESLVEKLDKTDLSSEASSSKEDPSAKKGPSHSQGPSGEGPSHDGPSGEGPSRDGPSGEGPSYDGPSGEGPSYDGPLEEGPSNDGATEIKVPSDKLELSNKESPIKEMENDNSNAVFSMHLHKHVLATIGKHGAVRIWSKTGKLIGSCGLSSGKSSQGRNKSSSWASLTWCRPDMLLIIDAKSQLLKCNPLQLDGKNKLETHLIHAEHKRGLHCVATNAGRRPAPASPAVWTAAQDRLLVCHLLDEGTTTVYNTCGGFIYNVQTCPYDATRVAVSVGDGAVRVWTAEESETEGKVTPGQVHTYWQHVQGKVLTVEWHPTKENLLAYGTAEARVGVLEARGPERPGRALAPALGGGVYSLCWAGGRLYAAARGDLVLYNPDAPDEAPSPVAIVVEGAAWLVSAARAAAGRLAVGGDAGGVAVLAEPGHALLAVHHPFSKLIHTVAWHPEQTSCSSEESKYQNLLAVCSQDKANTVVILELIDTEDGGHKLQVYTTLAGHASTVLQVAWSPHQDLRLLTTSHDGTVRVWDVSNAECLSVFAGHASTALGAAWWPWPGRAGAVLSGGADCCLRVWDAADHPFHLYDPRPPIPKKDRKKKTKKSSLGPPEGMLMDDHTLAAITCGKPRASNKFILPTVTRQIGNARLRKAKTMLINYMDRKYIEEQMAECAQHDAEDLDFIKMFGKNNEVNEVFDSEMERHIDTGNIEAWIVLSVFRGHIDAMMQYASEKNLICPYLLSIAPSVSNKYWRDASRLYLTQIDRLVANGEEEKLVANRSYGGPVYRKAMTLLSLQDVKGAVSTLCEARLHKEAYLLCRIRYIDTIAEEVLQDWAKHCIHSGVPDMAAICYIALGNLLEAATVLGKCNDQESLSLAADLAKAAGQTILSDNIMERRSQIKDKTPEAEEEVLEQLPSKVELLLKIKQEEVKHEDINENVDQNGQCEEATLPLKDKLEEAKDEDFKENVDQNGQHEEAVEN